ncbi:GIY-YIG nuclease family protein [Guptibacillus hwajinpoensis]|uniref:GIY-YIG nuclease family protein n=1 Tax=Guptibacillus hwajinpoensis TaxID=208199 RepID=UPI001CFDD421|nr:GIY-YIG nuclease family protein [Pseudalkalibacillus hwajinpoensis]WLR60164.1 GIY-YIG nuclease family protein [Pseudalkalibacillus hwajinpoensis]
MDNSLRTIDDIKFQVKQLIQENSHREVTPATKNKSSGIYMLYIDHFTSERIVPIYVGQAKDIQRRHKQHFTEILALNRLSSDEYNKYFFLNSSSFYEGKFKACKIFKYMLENDCSLQNLHMVVLEEVEHEYLDAKEQEYFKRLLPSFFGFNQLNSLLKLLSFRFSDEQMNNTDIGSYLKILLDDIRGVNSYYNYGFTQFNFEHSMPTDISFLLREQEQMDCDIDLKFKEVRSSLMKLCEQYKPDYREVQRLNEKKNRLYEVYKNAKEECNRALDLLTEVISGKFEDLQIYDEDAINDFICSIKYKNNPDYKVQFRKYLKSKKCKLDFYQIFNEQIKEVNTKIKLKDYKQGPYNEVLDLSIEKEDKLRSERYKMIFPTCQFDSFSLKDIANDFSIQTNDDQNFFNTSHIQLYISNNAINRSFEYRKDPFIIRFDYCYIDIDGNKIEKKYYIDNETNRECQSGIFYIEKDYYNMFAIKKEKFKISSIINHEIDNSFISVLAEYKHGINDYTIKNKQLIKLSTVLEEIQKLVDDETRFSIKVSESYKCLENCMINEGIKEDAWIEKLLTKKLPKVKKKRRVNKKLLREVNVDNKVSREESYKQKVLKRSDNAVNVVNYVSSREKVKAQCNNCGYEWKIRSDHLLTRPYCPLCRKK